MLNSIAAQTSGLTARDMRGIAADASAFMMSRLLSARMKHGVIGDDQKSLQMGTEVALKLTAEDLEKAFQRVKMRTASAIGTPKVWVLGLSLLRVVHHVFLSTGLILAHAVVSHSQVPNVKWEDVGGLEDVKKAILDTVQVISIH